MQILRNSIIRISPNFAVAPITRSTNPICKQPLTKDIFERSNVAFTAKTTATAIPNKKESYSQIFDQAVTPVKTCENYIEQVGEKTDVKSVLNNLKDEITYPKQSIENATTLTPQDKDGRAIRAINLVTKDFDRAINYEIYSSQKPISKNDRLKYEESAQDIQIKLASDKEYPQDISIMNTKGKLLATMRDGNNVIMTNNGHVCARNGAPLHINAAQKNQPVAFNPFEPIQVSNVDEAGNFSSIGKGAELIIGLENGRFVKETIASIEEFQTKIRNGEVPLPQFNAADGAQDLQITMLAGGFGSRAEYTNVSSAGIFNAKTGARQSTKGVYRTPTGLTPMETTFVSLHLAGILDCSKENFGIGQNVKFYLNKSDINRGNGGFTLDMYDKIATPQTKAEFIFPNDSISRMPVAIKAAAEKINDGSAAIALISKRVPAKEAQGTFGIMRLGENNQILSFAEKPNPIPKGFTDNQDMCLTSTFQFAVSKESFEALKIVESDIGFKNALSGKETRDWSGQLVPIILVLTSAQTPQQMRDLLPVVTGKESNRFLDNVSDETLMRAKAVLGEQKVCSIPTDEPWADVGQLDAMYDVTMQIAKGTFPLLPFEQRNVINSINTKTGLIAATPQQKAEIEEKYNAYGRVFAAPYADEAISNEIFVRNKDFIVENL
jgi:hypothetical protein